MKPSSFHGVSVIMPTYNEVGHIQDLIQVPHRDDVLDQDHQERLVVGLPEVVGHPVALPATEHSPLAERGELVAIMMIESPEAIEHVNEIAQVPGVTALFFGPGDYGRAIGKPSRLPQVAPETEAAVQTMLRACLAHGIPCGYPVAGPPDALQAETEKRLAQGFQIVTQVNLEAF